ncbi:IS110 family transposase [Solwaraspora sp. WMMA2065]|uniref:IS110 family transposase n=1 Tax=Solwaraspora sp. WMMA2065 TaxID=3015166 RepID=UPI00259BF22E|nr:IS110 family transposase [Solwaraspora sp. WMMA2065]WJK37773.1 IS110 family transposase [Solwaraspora sp. WMMA2065]
MPSITPDIAAVEVVGGVDTHQDTHTAAVIDLVGRVLGTQQFPATTAGYTALLTWMRGFGRLLRVGVEGTGAYGAGLARRLRDEQVELVEVDRPDRKTRRFQGKSDPIDAIQAAKAALAGERTGTPEQRDGRVEALRNLRVARRSAVDQRADTQRQIKALIVTAPDQLRAQLRGLAVKQLIATCASLQLDPADAAAPATAATIALRSLARRHQQLSAEITELDELLEPLVAAINPGLLAAHGVGPDVAGQLLVTVGENHDRLTSEAGFAMLCGVAPIPASSGRTNRHRLNRGGDRQANAALYRVVLVRLRWDPRTRAYAEQRTKEGLSKKEIIRCLKRYVARELYQLITSKDLELAA